METRIPMKMAVGLSRVCGRLALHDSIYTILSDTLLLEWITILLLTEQMMMSSSQVAIN